MRATPAHTSFRVTIYILSTLTLEHCLAPANPPTCQLPQTRSHPSWIEQSVPVAWSIVALQLSCHANGYVGFHSQPPFAQRETTGTIEPKVQCQKGTYLMLVPSRYALIQLTHPYDITRLQSEVYSLSVPRSLRLHEYSPIVR